MRSLKSLPLPPELGDEVQRMENLLRENRKLDFFTSLLRFIDKANTLLMERKEVLRNMSQSVREFFEGFSKSFTELLLREGIKVTTDRALLRGIETTPKSVELVREAFKSLIENKIGEFVGRLRLIGINVEEPEKLMSLRERILPQLERIIETAVKGLLNKWESESLKELTARFRSLGEEVRNLESVRSFLENVPKEVRENLTKLEVLGLIQSFAVSHEGKRFFIPFKIDEGEGVIAFTREDQFKIFVKLRYEEGYVGIVMIAPKSEKPDYISLFVKTDMESFRSAFEREKEVLRRELEELGLEIKRFEVGGEEERKFDGDFVEEFAKTSLLNLRV
jgi:uncharacterized protein (DUF2461 family)